MRYTYPVLVIEDELGGYCTYLNDFDQVTEGEDIAEAIEMGADALWLMIDDYLQLDKPLPKPTYPEEHEGLLVAISVDVDTERGLLTTKMAAGLLGVSDARVRQMVCSGQLASKKIGRDNYVCGASASARPTPRSRAAPGRRPPPPLRRRRRRCSGRSSACIAGAPDCGKAPAAAPPTPPPSWRPRCRRPPPSACARDLRQAPRRRWRPRTAR